MLGKLILNSIKISILVSVFFCFSCSAQEETMELKEEKSYFQEELSWTAIDLMDEAMKTEDE